MRLKILLSYQKEEKRILRLSQTNLRIASIGIDVSKQSIKSCSLKIMMTAV